MQKLLVSASKSYCVTISDNFDDFNASVGALIQNKKVALIVDETPFNYYKQQLKNLLCDFKILLIKVKSGEKSKNAKNYIRILNLLAKNNFTRSDCVLTFGGGVVGDLGAFVASTYMRGIMLITVPTTLLADVDSSIGGKTAINLDRGKNLCGTFYQPYAVYINTCLLKSLNKNELDCGFGEIIKYYFICPSLKVYDYSEKEKLIYECLKIKAQIVFEDEYESKMRKLLNFGHTLGHAIERISKFSIPHGICVLYGIEKALKISSKYYNYGNENLEKFNFLLNKYKIKLKKLDKTYSADNLYKCMLNDKKANQTGVDFVLINEQDQPTIEHIEFANLKELINL